jgi:parallel beta-helix repeat protein
VPSGNYKTIQAAVNAASAGNTILVSNGTYTENVVIGKSLTLKAATGATPVIDAGNKGPGIKVTASNVRVEGFTVQNAASNCGIYVTATGASIVSDRVSACRYGIFLVGSTSCTLQGDTVTGATGGGICLVSSKSNVVTKSTTSGNAIGLLINGTSTGNTLYLNDFLDPPSAVTGNTFNTPAKQTYTYKGKQYSNYLGNYWSGYTGKDANGNGLGDSIYTLGQIRDTVPLMLPYTNYK